MSKPENRAAEQSGSANSWTHDGTEARKWWAALQPSKNGDERAGGGNRAALARLRRCSTWVEAATEPETALLFREIGYGKESRLRRVAVLAAVLAHVREDDKSASVASSVGPKGEDAKVVLSTLRLRRLLTTEGNDAILTAFRRLVALNNAKANVADLTHLILNWDSEWNGERTRMRFAFDYWQSGPAAPQDLAPADKSAQAADA